MPLPDRRSRAHLAEMGVDVWVKRSPRSLLAAENSPRPAAEARVRLSAGGGSWLLVQRRPWDGRHTELLADIQALLGPAQCRFGHWADSREAGIGLSELAARGIMNVVAFGPRPHDAESPDLIVASSLDELASSGAARRSLWQALRPRLSD